MREERLLGISAKHRIKPNESSGIEIVSIFLRSINFRGHGFSFGVCFCYFGWGGVSVVRQRRTQMSHGNEKHLY